MKDSVRVLFDIEFERIKQLLLVVGLQHDPERFGPFGFSGSVHGVPQVVVWCYPPVSDEFPEAPALWGRNPRAQSIQTRYIHKRGWNPHDTSTDIEVHAVAAIGSNQRARDIYYFTPGDQRGFELVRDSIICFLGSYAAGWPSRETGLSLGEIPSLVQPLMTRSAVEPLTN